MKQNTKRYLCLNTIVNMTRKDPKVTSIAKITGMSLLITFLSSGFFPFIVAFTSISKIILSINSIISKSN